MRELTHPQRILIALAGFLALIAFALGAAWVSSNVSITYTQDFATADIMVVAVTYARDERVAEFEELLASDPSLLQRKWEGWTLIHAAAATDSDACIRVLHRLGADLDALSGPFRSRNQVPDTAMHMAIRGQDWNAVRALIECGASIDVPDGNGDTARDLLERLPEGADTLSTDNPD